MNLTEDRPLDRRASPVGPDGGSATGPGPDQLTRALEEYRSLLEAGRRPQREEFLARYPDIAAALSECLAGLEFVHGAAPALSQNVPGGPAGASVSAADHEPALPLGDFRIVREIGRGGMGVVYEAVQLSLGRRVALKVLPLAAGLDAKQLQRFRNEAQAAAGLHHTNIVPVYAVGSERGVHFYAMQLIDGQTLAAIIVALRAQPGAPALSPAQVPTGADVPTPPVAAASTQHAVRDPAFFRTVARLGVQAAEALEHAHELGVIHRDVKPANLLVDGRGNLWITDFGLAHCQSQAGLTLTGDLLGTLRYMSPEQALAQRVPIDHRTDIYSLGVTLYELMTLEPAFGGNDRHELLRQIAVEEPKPPRRLNRLVPAELETVVLKALEKNPADRYATAGELADDLGRFLEDQPIRARRPTVVHKVRKWARRNRAALRMGLASLILLLAAIAAVSGYAAWRLSEEQEATSQQLKQTREAEEKGKRELYRSLVAQARANRLSRVRGRRLRSLEILADATRLARELHLPDRDFLDLRNETIACLPLVDLRVARTWEGSPARTFLRGFDADLERYVRFDHQHGVASVRRVADDGEVCQVRELGQFPDVPSVGLSPDGRFLGLWGPVLKVWRVTKGGAELLLQEPGHTLSFSPDSRRLAMARHDGAIHVYELPSGKQLNEWPSGPSPGSLAFHPAGRQLAVSHRGRITVFDGDTGKKLAEFRHPKGWGDGLEWHPDGKQLAAVGDACCIYVWEASTGRLLHRLAGHTSGGVGLAFNPAGDLLASCGWDRTLRLWDTRTGQELFKTTWNGLAYGFSRNGRLLAADVADRQVRLWEVVPPCAYQSLAREPHLGQGRYGSSAVSSKHRLLAVGMQDGVGLWELPGGRPLTFLSLGGNHGVGSFESSGALLSYGRTGQLRWPIEAVGPPGTLRIGPPRPLPFPASPGPVATSRDGRVMASAQSWGALVWHADKGDRLIRLAPQHDVRWVAVSPNGRWVATGSHWATDVYVKVWDARTGRHVADLPVEGGGVGFSPDEPWLVTTGGGCRLWAVATWREGPRIGGGPFAFSPDGKVLAVATGSRAVRLVDPSTGREYARLEDPNQDRAFALTFSTDGSQLFASTQDSPAVHVWDLRAIRAELAQRNLDWDLPPYPPAGDPKDAPPLRVTVDLGDWRRAERAKDYNNRAWFLATCAASNQRDPGQAVQLAQQAVELAPKEGSYWNTLGAAHYRAASWKEAIAALEKSLNLQGDNSFDWVFLAMAHWQLGHKEMARQWYDRAVQWMDKNQPALKQQHQEELRRFRAEATELLGIKEQMTDHEVTKEPRDKP
jgi:serine/threonine protein kinase/WD40 repeat protein